MLEDESTQTVTDNRTYIHKGNNTLTHTLSHTYTRIHTSRHYDRMQLATTTEERDQQMWPR